jgi:hypothetical protein
LAREFSAIVWIQNFKGSEKLIFSSMVSHHWPLGQELPTSFELLSSQDQDGYHALRQRVASPDHRYNRHRRIATMETMLKEISGFCNRQDTGDGLRSLVCGIHWFHDGQIAVNTLHLRILLGKSKSSINGALAMMQYNSVAMGNEERDKLLGLFPQLKGQWSEIRQWTIRERTAPSDVQQTGPDTTHESIVPVQALGFPQMEEGIQNIFAPDNDLVGFLRFCPNRDRGQGLNSFSSPDNFFS